jgi:hypothetical protein
MMIIGWSLVNSCIETLHSLAIKGMIVWLKKNELIPVNSKVALGQKFLDKAYRGKGIMDLAILIQDEITFSKFDTYLSTVQKTNKPSKFFVQKNHFQEIYEDEIRYYFIKPITERKIAVKQSVYVKNGDSTLSVTIRPGAAGDEVELHELNKRWLKEALPDLSAGFLTTLYSIADFREMIRLQEIVVVTV